MKRKPYHAPARRPNIKVISLFSGAMGLDLGLEKAGLRVAVAVECDPVAVATIKLNKPRLAVIAKRIEKVTAAEIKKAGKIKRGDQLIVVGGPSCQAFSTAGQRKSLEDPRGNLFREFVRIVNEIQPRFFIMENVRGLLSAAAKHRPLVNRGPGNPKLKSREELGSAFRQIVSAFKELNYYVAFDILNAADFGAPQARERLVFIGSRRGELIVFPTQTHDKLGRSGLPKWTALRSVIGDLGRRKPEYKKFSAAKASLLKRIPEGGNWRDLPKRMQAKAIGGAYLSWGGRSGFLRRLAWDKPSPALVTTPDGNATCLCHPNRIRPLSVQEYARIQQFPDSWKFSGSTRQKYRQIGNAVPIGLGKVLGNTIKQAMQQKKRKNLAGVVECMSIELVQKLGRSRRTYLNPKRMRKKEKSEDLTTWLEGKPRYRKETLVYASSEVRKTIEKMKKTSGEAISIARQTALTTAS